LVSRLKRNSNPGSAPDESNVTNDIARIRLKLNCSQAVFAMMLNISPKTVQAWEQGLREPGDAALKLLSIAKKHPEILLVVRRQRRRFDSGSTENCYAFGAVALLCRHGKVNQCLV
jgi:DNA-binding transcriptional regulator YiaG